LLANFYCFFAFAKEITLYAFCLLFRYYFHASVHADSVDIGKASLGYAVRFIL